LIERQFLSTPENKVLNRAIFTTKSTDIIRERTMEGFRVTRHGMEFYYKEIIDIAKLLGQKKQLERFL
jgi:hypothetical protein